MKIIIIVALYIVVATGKKIPPEHLKEWGELVKDINQMCIKEHKTDETLIKDMLEHLKYPEDKPLKCYWHCLHQKLDLLDKNGEIDLDVVLKKVSFVTKELGMKCIDNHKNEKDKCEKAFKMVKCVMDELAV